MADALPPFGPMEPEAAPAAYRIADYMDPGPLCVAESAGLLKVCEHMAGQRIGQVLVVAEEAAKAPGPPPEPMGVFTERDLIRAFVRHRGAVMGMSVGELMTAPVVCVGPDEDVLDAADLMASLRIRRLPVVKDGRTVGLLTHEAVLLVQSRRLSDMARQNRYLERKAVHDPLTGLANRELFGRVLARELDSQRRDGGAVGVLELDLDHFKRVNDAHGHPAGDAVLVRLAGLLREHLRRADLAARVGGEEFAVVLSRGSAPAPEVAERLRVAVAAEPFPGAAEALRLTVSIGCAQSRPGETPEALFKRVDDALYRAKNAGRNRIQEA